MSAANYQGTKISEALGRKEASWQRMLLSQPPVGRSVYFQDVDKSSQPCKLGHLGEWAVKMLPDKDWESFQYAYEVCERSDGEAAT